MARLAEALDHIRHAAPADGANVVQREFEARRRQLNEHARRVNAPRPPSDLSVNRMMGMLLRLPVVARSALRFRGDALAALTAEPRGRDQAIDRGRHRQSEACSWAPTRLPGTTPGSWTVAKHKRRWTWRPRPPSSGPPSSGCSARSCSSSASGSRKPRRRGGPPVRAARRPSAPCALCRRAVRAQPAELARALAPATGGRAHRAWAFLAKKTTGPPASACSRCGPRRRRRQRCGRRRWRPRTSFAVGTPLAPPRPRPRKRPRRRSSRRCSRRSRRRRPPSAR